LAENSQIRVGVVFGGWSVEHEVSVITGIQALHALKDTEFQAFPIYIGKSGQWYCGDALAEIDRYRDTSLLARSAFAVDPLSGEGGRLRLVGKKKGFFSKTYDLTVDVLLVAMHGSEGENGGLQGLLETLNVPYTGSDVTASAVGMDKSLAKTLCRSAGVPVVDAVVIREHEWRGQEDARLRQCESTLGFPVIVKPCRLGSSIGISRTTNVEALESAVEEGLRLDEKILVESCIESLREFNCSVIGDVRSAEVSAIEEPVRSAGEALLSYEQKYQRGAKQSGSKSQVADRGMASLDRVIPAEIPETLAADIRRLAYKIFRTLGCSGVARIDFLYDEVKEQLFFNEINTIPGSFSFYLWQPAGLPFDRLLTRLVEIALDRHRRKLGKIRSYDTDLLARNALGGIKGKTG
jgi:D-alanine-D-alanine ligase